MKKIKTSLKLFAISLLFAMGILGLAYGVCANSEVFKTSVNLITDKNIKPKETVSLYFSNPVLPATFEGKISIEPKQDVALSWSSNKTLLITPKNFWKPGVTYKIKIENGKNLLFFPVNNNLSFQTISYPSVKNFYPLSAEKEIAVNMENPISATFDGSIEDFSVKFILNPLGDLEYQINSDKTKISLLSKKELQGSTKYAIGVYIKYKGEDDSLYKNIYNTNFETIAPAPLEWDKNYQIRVAQALKYTKPQVATGKYIDINLKQQVMVIFENGTALDAYLVSSGKGGMETPAGTFAIRNKANRPWSKEYSLFMPNWMALVPDGKIGIHELPEWPSGYKEGANHLGTPVSHGCVRLGVGPAKRVFDWAEIGTPVNIHY